MQPQIFADLQRPDFKISSNFFSSLSICIKSGPSVWKLLHVIYKSSRSPVSLEFMLQDNTSQKHYATAPFYESNPHIWCKWTISLTLSHAHKIKAKNIKENYYPVSIAKWAFSVGRCESSQLHLFYRQAGQDREVKRPLIKEQYQKSGTSITNCPQIGYILIDSRAILTHLRPTMS